MAKKKKKTHFKKATDKPLCRDFLKTRADSCIAKGFKKQKWVEFCEKMMDLGLVLTLYEARRTPSKYITVRKPNDHSKKYKVRFSNHLPIMSRELEGDCDFFVGHTNLGIQTTDQAIKSTLNFFQIGA